MSFVFCINIVLGNVSLRYIPVSFMQTIKSFTPATTGNCVLFILLMVFILSMKFHIACILSKVYVYYSDSSVVSMEESF